MTVKLSDMLDGAADRCEAATGPDREIDCLIWAAVIHGGFKWAGNSLYVPSCDLRIGAIDPGKVARNFTCYQPNVPAYTASIDAAMSMVQEGHQQPSDIVRAALDRLGKKFNLHCSWWPIITPYTEYLARYIAAAALRARAAKAREAGL